MSTLYIRLPSKAVADNVPHWITLPCAFALVAQGEAIEREGVMPLSDLADMIARAQRVVLLLSASDVTLLRVQTPPLSPVRLKAALPGLVEDQLIADPAESVIVAGPEADGLRSVAVVQRGWIEILAKTMQAYNARHLVALPAQLCLPWQAGVTSAAVSAEEDEIDLTIRLGEQQGIGLPIVPEQPDTAARDVVQTLTALVPEAPVNLYVPQAAVRAFQDTVNELLALDQRITVHADNWPRWIAGAAQAAPDLMSATGGSTPTVDWRAWRWPLIVGGLALLINVIGLNISWLRMKREADTLRVGMTQIYRAAFPNETVIVDPIAQVKQKIAAAQHASGQPAPDDFLALAANFGDAWSGIGGGAIAKIEYHDRALTVNLKGSDAAPLDRLKPALAAHNLTVTQPNAGVLQIRSAK